jgi:Transposase DDE domain group 1
MADVEHDDLWRSPLDSSESPTYGEQEGSAYNGHFGCVCYHPLFVFNQLGDVERCALRSGNVHSADGWRAVLKPVMSVGVTCGKQRRERYVAARAKRRVRRFSAVSRRPGSLLACGEGNLSLREPVKGATLASKPPGI